MDRHREVRRGSSSSSMAANNGLTRRRPRNSNSLRDSPEEDGAMELQEPSRLRDRGGVSKKDRDRMSRNKRRRGDRLIHHHHHNNHNRGGDGGGGEDESSDENNNNSLDDDDEDDDEETGHGPVRMRPPTTTTNNTNTNTSTTTNNPSSSSLSNNNHHQLHHRKSFPPAKVGRTTTPWKVSDEMGFSVPKKARSVSTKRSHECWIPGGGGSGELPHRQASTSPARPTSVAPPPSSSVAPASPSSSSASIRKKMKPIGQKHRPPKVSSNNNNNIGNNNNKPSSVQDDIEIEVAEVLYGLMRQSQCPTRQEAATANSSQKLDSRDTNGSNNDAKSRVSSPVSASQSSKLPQNSSSSNTPMSAVAPKRKRPRPVRPEEQNSNSNSNSAVFANKKIEIEQSTKADVSSAKLEKISGSAENFTGAGFDFGNSSQPESVQLEIVKPESSSNTMMMMMDSKSLMTDESMDQTKKVVVTSPKKESSSCAKVEFDPENATATKATPTASVVESHREESFKFDLMAPPSKSSPERDSDTGFVSESKPVASEPEMKMESGEVKGKDNVDIDCKKKDTEEAVLLEKKREAVVEESETRKSNAHVKHTMLDLQIDLEKHNKDCGPSSIVRQQQQIPQQHQSKNLRSEPKLEKAAAAQSATNSLPLPMSLAGWPAGLPPVGNGMGQVRPQGMAALEGNPASSNFVQPRPKRCATHCYVAKTIYCHQQLTKMNPFWPAAAGPASLYGKQPYNLNVLPPTETAMIGNPLLGSFPGRTLNPMQEKSQADGAKDKSSVAANFMDSQPGKLVPKQLVLQQPPQQPALHGPAFIFPLNQQQAAVATTNKTGAPKPSNNANATSSVAAQSAAAAPGNSSSTAAAAATTMSFNYPNMPGSEAQYVAILQNNGYPFPVPAHVGAQPTPFRGTPQAMPFFNGSFYSSQMMHTSQLQQQQQQLQQQMQQAQSQQAPIQQGHQNTSTSSGSSSSQKHQQQHNQQQNHQQRLQSSGGNAGSGNSTSFNASKNRTPKLQNQSFPGGPQVRQHEADMGVDDSPSTEDSRVSQAHKNVYNHNFAMPIHPKNFASMSSAALTGGGSGNHSERQQHQQQQQQSIKGGPELISNQAFAMPFASFNGGTAVSGLDFSSMAQNHVIFQSIPEAARHGYQQQMAAAAAAAQAAQHKKSHQISEEGKAVSDSNNAEEERKVGIGKVPPSMGQAIVFSRPDYTDPSVSTILGNSVVESSARTLNLISSPGNGSRPSRSNTSATASVPSTSAAGNSSNSQQHQQQQQQQQQQMSQFMQLQKQQQQQQHQQMAVMQQQQHMHQQQLAAAAAARAKPSTTNSSSVYTDRHSSSSMAGKFPNAHYFPELPVQSGSSTQSQQWKTTRTTASPVSSPSLASNMSSLKNLPQQQGRTQQGHTQISFGVNSKPGSAQHVQQMPTGNQSPSSPVVVGSPPTSVSKSAGGSPRASSTGSKVGTTSSLSSQQQAKNTSSGPSRKSSPVGGRNVPSNLGNSHANPAQCTTTKSQSHHQQQQQQHQQQQQQQKALQQAQLLFSNAYMQAHSPQSTSNNSNTSGTPSIGYFQHRRQPAEQQQQQQPGSSNTVSSGMLALSPSLTLAGATTDPTKAVQAAAAAAQAAAANMKGGLPPPGLLQAAQYATQAGGHQFMSYIHSVPPVQVKPSEQKQPAGNDNLRASWQPEKR